jgi:AcrR family transcriptional regulator
MLSSMASSIAMTRPLIVTMICRWVNWAGLPSATWGAASVVMSGSPSGIQQVALRLFTEHGYENTSMREISEHLGLTKAALYYHFDSKEAIVQSLFEERLGTLEKLAERAEEQPYSAARCAEIATGWFGLTVDDDLRFVRFTIANQAALRDLMPSRDGARDLFERLSSLMAGPDASPAERLKVRMAMMSVNLAAMSSVGLDLTNAEILAAAAETADLILPGFSAAVTGRASVRS